VPGGEDRAEPVADGRVHDAAQEVVLPVRPAVGRLRDHDRVGGLVDVEDGGQRARRELAGEP
jgi:septum formation inhibitor-activating ATPase MinD